MRTKLAIAFACLVATGCSMMPYEEDFACEKNATFGKCVSVGGAYEEAVTGKPQGKVITKDGVEEGDDSPESDDRHSQSEDDLLVSSEDAAYAGYRTELYTQLRSLVAQPETPMVRKAEQNRTLILSYSPDNQSNRLYMPRYIYSIHRSAEFVMGQYKLEQDPSMRLLKEFLRDEEK